MSAVLQLEPDYRLLPVGDQCVSIEFGTRIDVQVNQRACALARRIEEAGLAGVVDVLPAFASVGVHYLADAVPTEGGELPQAAVMRRLRALADMPAQVSDAAVSRVVEIPVCYGGEYGPDLADVAQATGMSEAEVVALHSEAPLRVFMIGFTPGHPYIGLLDARLDLKRRASPRTAVPAGSIAIANRQSVIYPLVTPGGWHIIGRTPLRLFDVTRYEPCLLQAGDGIRFRPVSADEFSALEGKQ